MEKTLSDFSLQKKYEELLKFDTSLKEEDVNRRITEIRELVLKEGIPEDQVEGTLEKCTLRGRIWKLLLHVGPSDVNSYLQLIKRGESHVYNKIRADTFRTFPTNLQFSSRVSEEALIRVLNAFANVSNDLFPTNGPKPAVFEFSYVQGMNVLLAPFLYTMTEVEAFSAFTHLLHTFIPLYVQPTLDGAHFGVKLLDEVLEAVDSELHQHLHKYNLHAAVYAFRVILTLGASVPPLEEVLKLWDFLFAFGPHLNIATAAAIFISMRTEILNSTNPKACLRQPQLKVSVILPLAASIANMLPPDLLSLIESHVSNPEVYKRSSS